MAHFDVRPAIQAENPGFTLGSKPAPGRDTLARAVEWLIRFRVVWGVLGSTYARFVQFFPTPGKVKAYLRGEWHGVGHNPLGAFSVFGLLGLLAFQVTSGLFSNDDIAFVGPLFGLVSKDLSNQLTGLHELASNVIYLLIGRKRLAAHILNSG
jgi:cytochrome b